MKASCELMKKLVNNGLPDWTMQMDKVKSQEQPQYKGLKMKNELCNLETSK